MDSDYIIILCGHFNDNYVPLTRSEFWKLYHQCGDSVKGIVESEDEKVKKLLDRSGSVAFGIETLKEMGIRIRTFLDEEFPERLYSKLKDFCPPLLYMCGESNLLKQKYVGYVGSRNINESDVTWTQKMVQKNLYDNFGIVSGGAKGIDSISITYSLNNGGFVIAFLPDNMKNWIQDKFYRDFVMNGRLLLCSHVSPFAPKTKNSFVSAAMERNKLIYAQSNATVVVKSDYNKGGTWAGATEALRHKWVPVFVWDNKKYEGNKSLIEKGGIPLSDDGEKGIATIKKETKDCSSEQKQMTIFDLTDGKNN